MLSRMLLPAAALAVVTVAGCDKEDSVAVTLASVERELASAHAGGAAAAPPAMRQDIYNNAVNSLQQASREGSQAQKDAASLLLAQAHSGMAQIESSEATELENRLLERATRLRAQLDLYSSQSALASALASIDPAEERAALEQAVSQVDVRLSDAQQARRALQEESGWHQEAVDANATEARKLRAMAGELRARALDAPATEAAELAADAYEVEREAAALETESSRQGAEVEKIEPRLTEQDRLVARLNEERTQLTEALRRVDLRVQDARQQAQEARAAARAAADEALAMLDEIESLRAGELTELWSQAVRHAQSAVSAMTQVRPSESGARSTAAILRGEAQHRLGEMNAAKARGVERYLVLLDAISNATPTVPFIDQARAFESRAEAALLESGQAAADAFEQAAGTYQSAGVRDQEIRDRLERLQRMLQEAAGMPDDADANVG